MSSAAIFVWRLKGYITDRLMPVCGCLVLCFMRFDNNLCSWLAVVVLNLRCLSDELDMFLTGAPVIVNLR